MPSRTRRKLLELLIFSPESEFYLREISRRIDENTNSVSRELSQLQKANLVIQIRKGNFIFYKINKSSPIFSTMSK